MGIRGEIHSTTVSLKNRTYFFNVKENRVGDLYLNIVESKNKDEGGFERQSVMLFADDLQDFLKGFDESLKVMEKASREKQKTAPREARPRGEWSGDKGDGNRSDRPPRGDFNRDRPGRPDDGNRKRFVKKGAPGTSGAHSASGFRNDRPFGGKGFGESRGGDGRSSFGGSREGGSREGGFKKFSKEGFAPKTGHNHDGGWKSAGASGVKKGVRKARVVRAVPHHNQG